jgi:hypothetical protein
VRLNRYGRALARKQSGRGRAIRLVFTVDDGDGATRTAEHRARLLR